MIRRIFTAIWQMIRGVLALPGDLLRFLGLGGPALPPPAAFEHMAEDEADSLREELRAPARTIPLAVRTMGEHVHGYAVSADRTAYDLSLVPENVAVALLSLTERQLQDMAAAGPEACGRWALGMRSGIVGLPAVSGTRQAAGPEPRCGPDAAGEPRDGMPLPRAA